MLEYFKIRRLIKRALKVRHACKCNHCETGIWELAQFISQVIWFESLSCDFYIESNIELNLSIINYVANITITNSGLDNDLYWVYFRIS